MATQEEIDAALNAILGIESSRDYGSVGPTHPRLGRALGGFQVMEANLRPWLRDAGMADMTPEEFLRSPEAQNRLFRHRFGMYANRYGLEGASRAWFAGEGGMNDPNRRDVFGTTVDEYARRFNAQLGQGNRGGPNMGDGNIETTNVNTPDVRNQPEQPNTWTQWLSSPTNRAFLMSAGAQMAQPTWGNAASNFSLGLAGGQQAAAETGNRINEEERRRLELQSSEVQGELNRRSLERRTSTAAESRLDVAGLRANAMLERARMIGLRGTGQQNEFMRSVRAIYSSLLQNNPAAMTDPALQEQLFNQSMERAARSFQEQLRLQGQQPPANEPPPARQPPPGPAPPPPSGPSGQVPTSGRATWEPFMAIPGFERMYLQNRMNRGRLYAQRPDIRGQIDRWVREHGG